MDPELLQKLINLSKETEWLEFKTNMCIPNDLGDYFSAISNSARLYDQPRGYLIYGITDDGHSVVGTEFDPYNFKGKGDEDLIPWYSRMLNPKIDIEIQTVDIDGKNVVAFIIPAAINNPTSFAGREKIRIEQTTHNLKDYPEKERQLWAKLNTYPFEFNHAVESLNATDALALLSVESYFDLLKQPMPDTRDEIVEILIKDRVLEHMPTGIAITNLGALLFAKDLNQFQQLARKAPRVIRYEGTTRKNGLREQVGVRGYAVGFEALLNYVRNQLPARETIDDGLRADADFVPGVAIREFVANALIHQDFTVTGTAPMIEIFDDRIEVTNPGRPLVDTDRFIDHPPRSRNEGLSGMMHRLGICEERGSGVDRALLEIEAQKLPAPKFEAGDDFCRINLYANQPYAALDTTTRIRACYQHACVQHFVEGTPMSNASLRERLGIEEANYSIVSRLIKETLEAGLIKVHDPLNKSTKHRKYLPYWA
jgi:predicted HTH transcriptional regulator